MVQSLRSWAHYQHDVYVFHTKFLNDSTHPYSSKPAGWLLLNRPVGVDAQNDIKPGVQGCAAPADSTCQRQVLLLGNPVIWWGGCLALLWGLLQWVGARDWRYGVALVGVASTWLPWLRYDDRPIFLFYAVATLPFLVLALTLALGQLIGADRATLAPAHRRRGRGRLLHGPDDPGLRVVLADLDRRAAHPQRVARPDVVLPLDLDEEAGPPDVRWARLLRSAIRRWSRRRPRRRRARPPGPLNVAVHPVGVVPVRRG